MFFTTCVSESDWGSRARKVLPNPRVSCRQHQPFVLCSLNKVLVAVLMIWREEKSASGAVCATSSCEPPSDAASVREEEGAETCSSALHAEIRSRKITPGFCKTAGLPECGCANAPALFALSCFSLCQCVMVGRGIFWLCSRNGFCQRCLSWAASSPRAKWVWSDYGKIDSK